MFQSGEADETTAAFYTNYGLVKTVTNNISGKITNTGVFSKMSTTKIVVLSQKHHCAIAHNIHRKTKWW